MKKPNSLAHMRHAEIRDQLRKLRQRGKWHKPRYTLRMIRIPSRTEKAIDKVGGWVTIVLSAPAALVAALVWLALYIPAGFVAVLRSFRKWHKGRAEYRWVEETFPTDETDSRITWPPMPPSLDSDEWEPIGPRSDGSAS